METDWDVEALARGIGYGALHTRHHNHHDIMARRMVMDELTCIVRFHKDNPISWFIPLLAHGNDGPIPLAKGPRLNTKV